MLKGFNCFLLGLKSIPNFPWPATPCPNANGEGDTSYSMPSFLFFVFSNEPSFLFYFVLFFKKEMNFGFKAQAYEITKK